MKTLVKRILIGAIPLAMMSSCETALEKLPFNSITDASAFSTADRCLLSLYGVYDAAQSSPYTDGSVRGYPFGAANIEQGDARGEDVINVAAFFQITYQATYNTTTANNVGHWGALYALINKANISIDGFKNAAKSNIITAAAASQFEAECRFLRALAHHEAVTLYARPYLDGNGNKLGVPYRDFAINSGSAVDQVRAIPRPTVAENYEKILADLDFAETNLPATLSPGTVRATKAAAIALKQRVKLHKGDWAGVIAEGAKLVPAAAPFVSPIGKDLGHGRFDPYVVPVLIGKSPDQHGQRFHGKEMPGHVAQPNLLSLPLCQRFLEGDAGIGSVNGRLPCLLGHAEANGRNADPTSHIQNGECIFQSLADFADDVFDRDLHLLQRDVGILDASAAFELTPLPYQQSRCGHVENKRRVDPVVCSLSFLDGHPLYSSVP